MKRLYPHTQGQPLLLFKCGMQPCQEGDLITLRGVNALTDACVEDTFDELEIGETQSVIDSV